MKSHRIASLLASGTEIVCALGCADQLVAISHECDYPADVLDRPRVTRSLIDDRGASQEIDDQVRQAVAAGRPLYDIDVERLRSLSIDLIITQSQCEVCAVSDRDVAAVMEKEVDLRRAEAIALNPTSLASVLQDIRRVGAAISRTEEAKRYVDRLTNRIDAIVVGAAHIQIEARPRVMCVEWLEPLMVAANWMPELIELAGGRSGLTSAGMRSRVTRWEEVLEYDPEVIVVMPCGFDLHRAVEEAPVLARRTGWSNIRAVREGRVFAVDGNAYFNRSGPRLVESLEILAGIIHPALNERRSPGLAGAVERLSL